jgi:transcriptional regulator with XRE-family HTH domain
MTRSPHPIDCHVGLRLKMRRKMISLSQEELGQKLGVTFQQVQKYERGANRVSASTLYHLAKILDVPVSFFFDDQDPVRAAAVPDGFLTAPESVVDPQLSSAETRALVAAFFAIEDMEVKQAMLRLLRALAEKRAEPGNATPGRRRGRRALADRPQYPRTTS